MMLLRSASDTARLDISLIFHFFHADDSALQDRGKQVNMASEPGNHQLGTHTL